MWFAALGSYQHNPWLLNLVVRLLQGHPEVLALLDEVVVRSPSRAPALQAGAGGELSGLDGGVPLKFIRALRYEYDFEPPVSRTVENNTPRGSSADKSQGGDNNVGGRGGRGGGGVVSSSAPTGGSQGRESRRGGPWWRRSYTGEYLPALSLDSSTVKAYIQQQGWTWPGRYLPRETNGNGGDGGEAAWRRRLRGWPNGAGGAALAGAALTAVFIGAEALVTRLLLEGLAAEDKDVIKVKDV